MSVILKAHNSVYMILPVLPLESGANIKRSGVVGHSKRESCCGSTAAKARAPD